MRLTLPAKVDQLKRKSVVGQIVVVAICIQILFLGSFVAVRLPTATRSNLVAFAHNEARSVMSHLPSALKKVFDIRVGDLSKPSAKVRFSLYTPIIPLAIFVGYVAGSQLGFIASLLYLAGGLICPYMGIYPFAEGGGIDYWRQPGFGYLLGLTASAWWAGKATSKSRTSFRQCLAVAGGLILAHFIGLVYLFGSCLASVFTQGSTYFPAWRPFVFEEARNMTWYPLIWDLTFSIAAVGLGFPFRALVGTLVASEPPMRGQTIKAVDDLV